MNDKKIKCVLLAVVFFITISLVSNFAFAYCTPDDWWVCEGSSAVHYTIDSDCNTYSNSMYCQYGCSNGYCLSAPYTTTTTLYYYVCTPWTTTDRYCASSTQVAYYRCNVWGTGWDYVVESCPYWTTTCSNGYCTSQPQCTEGYTGNYGCSGNWRQQQYQYSDCSTTWMTLEYCSNGCSNGYCTSAPACTPQYLDVWQCSGNWRQRQYQNADCSLVWQTYDYCDNGCSGGQCIIQQCTPHYFDSYQCSGNWRQQQYQSSDCSIQWYNVEYCQYGCSADHCISRQPCRISASVSTPSDTYSGSTVYSTVSFYNSGDSSGYVYFTAYVCRSDGSNCQRMSCDGFDSSVYIGGYETRSFTCSKTVSEPSLYKIRLDFHGCDTSDPTIYSGTFNVWYYPACTTSYLDNFQCLGIWKQQQYRSANCEIEWRNVLYCDYGCSAGECSEAPKKGTPEISVEPEYAVYRCEKNKFTFDISNTGEARDSFDISFSGPAAQWIKSVSSISLDPQETKTVNAYASIPCSAEEEYELTISAKDGEETSAATLLSVAEQGFLPITLPTLQITGWTTFLTTVFYALLFIAVVGAVFILLLLFVWRLPKRREGPEGFGPNISFVKKRPESFAERECHR